jgi:hypothetical protein
LRKQQGQTHTGRRDLSAEPQQPSLYERLSRIYSIAVVIDDFIDRVMADGRLNANPAVNEAQIRVPPAGFKYLVTEMVGVRPANRIAASAASASGSVSARSDRRCGIYGLHPSAVSAATKPCPWGNRR